MIQSMHIENFKCFKDFDIELGPFNVLIGPNDSGKTAFLDAIRACAFVNSAPGQSVDFDVVARAEYLKKDGLALGPHIFWRDDRDCTISIAVDGVTVDEEGARSQARLGIRSEGKGDHLAFVACYQDRGSRKDWGPFCDWAGLAGRPQYYRFAPAQLRKPSPIERDQDAPRLMSDGDGFPTFLEDLLRADRRRFADMENAFYTRFPHYDNIDVAKEGGENLIRLRTRSGHILDSADVSDGAMLCLAYLAVTYQPDPPKVLLIEEPENGVHHASLKETVAGLKDLAAKVDVQVILTTHSPYLLDCVEPDEVRVFSKDEEGAVHAVRLSDYPDIAKLREQDFMTGEIWSMLSESKIVDTIRGAGAAK